MKLIINKESKSQTERDNIILRKKGLENSCSYQRREKRFFVWFKKY